MEKRKNLVAEDVASFELRHIYNDSIAKTYVEQNLENQPTYIKQIVGFILKDYADEHKMCNSNEKPRKMTSEISNLRIGLIGASNRYSVNFLTSKIRGKEDGRVFSSWYLFDVIDKFDEIDEIYGARMDHSLLGKRADGTFEVVGKVGGLLVESQKKRMKRILKESGVQTVLKQITTNATTSYEFHEALLKAQGKSPDDLFIGDCEKLLIKLIKNGTISMSEFLEKGVYIINAYTDTDKSISKEIKKRGYASVAEYWCGDFERF